MIISNINAIDPILRLDRQSVDGLVVRLFSVSRSDHYRLISVTFPADVDVSDMLVEIAARNDGPTVLDNENEGQQIYDMVKSYDGDINSKLVIVISYNNGTVAGIIDNPVPKDHVASITLLPCGAYVVKTN